MSTLQLVVVGGTVFVASIVQVLGGFGFALLAVPVMSLAIETKQAVVIITLLGTGLVVWQAWHGRAHTDRPVATRMIAGAYLGMPLGLAVFLLVGDRTLQLILGVMVLVSVVLLWRRLDLRHAGPGLDAAAGFVSGVLETSLSTNGPPLAFALQARHLVPDAFRSTITTVFAYSNVLALVLFAASGKITGDALLAAVVALPALAVAQAIALPQRRRLDAERFRVLVLVLLVAAALSAIAGALG